MPEAATNSVNVGDTAPVFSLVSQSGERVSLKAYEGQWVVVFFYPKDQTPGCTKQVCEFRDMYQDFVDTGAQVLGISSDGVKSHQHFAQQHRLPFPILSDEGGRVRQLYGVPKTMGFLPGRVTYVIDPKGIVRHIFSSQLNINAHIQQALSAIQTSQ